MCKAVYIIAYMKIITFSRIPLELSHSFTYEIEARMPRDNEYFEILDNVILFTSEYAMGNIKVLTI